MRNVLALNRYFKARALVIVSLIKLVTGNLDKKKKKNIVSQIGKGCTFNSRRKYHFSLVGFLKIRWLLLICFIKLNKIIKSPISLHI